MPPMMLSKNYGLGQSIGPLSFEPIGHLIGTMFLVPSIYILDHYNLNGWFPQNNAVHPFDNLSAFFSIQL